MYMYIVLSFFNAAFSRYSKIRRTSKGSECKVTIFIVSSSHFVLRQNDVVPCFQN